MSAYHEPKDRNLDLQVKRSNAMINASYQSTLFAKKVTALAIASMSVQDDALVADLSVSDLRNQLGLKGNSVYNQIKGVSVETLGQKLLLEGENKKSFDLYNVFSQAKYDEDQNVLRLTFTDQIKQHTLLVKENYTTMRLSSLVNFESNHSYRLFELLSTHKYKIPHKENASYTFSMDLIDFRFKVGLVNTEKTYISEAMDQGRSLESIYEMALERAEVQRNQLKDARKNYKKSANSTYVEEKPDVLYPRWTDMKKRVLDVAVNEINKSDYCDIAVDYTAERKGRGGKIEKIIFTIRRNPNYKNIRNDISFRPARERPSDNALVNEVREFISEPLSEKDVLAILSAAEDDVSRIKAAYQFARKKGNIHNLVGWLISAIKEGWEDVSLDKKDYDGDTSGFNNHSIHDYDMNELEKILLATNDNVGKADKVIDVTEENIQETEENRRVEEVYDRETKLAEIMANEKLSVAERMELLKTIEEQYD